MTRFARAKGSKSSNEKKPEEATSWSELKNAALLKNLEKNEMPQSKQNQNKVTVENTPEKVKWASLRDDEFGKSIQLIKQHLGKKRKVDSLSNPEEKFIKKKLQKNIKTKESGMTKKKKKVLKSEPSGLENNAKTFDSAKKRSAEEISADASIKKMRKEIVKNINIQNKEDIKSEKKFQKEKKFKKPLSFKVEKEKDKKNDFKHKNKKNFNNFNNMFAKKQNSKDLFVDEVIVNGEKIPIVKYQGFNVTFEDAERLKKLRRELLKEGVPKTKLEAAIKLERRRAEKALSRLKKAVCFLCRSHGHLLSNCPNLKEKEDTSTGICYKCGSTEHTSVDCKVVRGTTFQFAECFICKEQGHIARQCPDNPRGLYPNGGACRECGDVTHLRKNCPKVLSEKAEKEITVGVREDRDLECLDEEIVSRQRKKKKIKKNYTVKF